MTQVQVSKEFAGFKWELMIPSNIDTEINEGRDWEPCVSQWIRGKLKKGDVAVDVGANIGWFTLLMSKCVGDEGQVYAFEPEPSFVTRLVRHIEINEIDNIYCAQIALIDINGEAWSVKNVGPYHSSATVTVNYSGPDALTIRCTCLDDYWYKDRLDLIKIDIDGNELRMLNGAKQTIDKFSPLIVMEIVDKAPAEFLEGMGYSLSREVSSVRANKITAADVPGILTPGMPTINIFGVRQ